MRGALALVLQNGGLIVFGILPMIYALYLAVTNDSGGFAGIDNPLFYDPKTVMLFGDAKASVSDITSEINAL